MRNNPHNDRMSEQGRARFEKILKLRDSGMTPKEIIFETGFSGSRVYDALICRNYDEYRMVVDMRRHSVRKSEIVEALKEMRSAAKPASGASLCSNTEKPASGPVAYQAGTGWGRN